MLVNWSGGIYKKKETRKTCSGKIAVAMGSFSAAKRQTTNLCCLERFRCNYFLMRIEEALHVSHINRNQREALPDSYEMFVKTTKGIFELFPF